MSEAYRDADETGRALVAVERARFMPAMSIESAVERYNAVTEFVSRVLRKEVDYGVIPGTEKRTLLKLTTETQRHGLLSTALQAVSLCLCGESVRLESAALLKSG